MPYPVQRALGEDHQRDGADLHVVHARHLARGVVRADVGDLVGHDAGELASSVAGEDQAGVDVEEAAGQRHGVDLVGVEDLDGERHLAVGVLHEVLADAVDVLDDDGVGDQVRRTSRSPWSTACPMPISQLVEYQLPMPRPPMLRVPTALTSSSLPFLMCGSSCLAGGGQRVGLRVGGAGASLPWRRLGVAGLLSEAVAAALAGSACGLGAGDWRGCRRGAAAPESAQWLCPRRRAVMPVLSGC